MGVPDHLQLSFRHGHATPWRRPAPRAWPREACVAARGAAFQKKKVRRKCQVFVPAAGISKRPRKRTVITAKRGPGESSLSQCNAPAAAAAVLQGPVLPVAQRNQPHGGQRSAPRSAAPTTPQVRPLCFPLFYFILKRGAKDIGRPPPQSTARAGLLQLSLWMSPVKIRPRRSPRPSRWPARASRSPPLDITNTRRPTRSRPSAPRPKRARRPRPSGQRQRRLAAVATLRPCATPYFFALRRSLSAAYAAGALPVRIDHGSVRNSLRWTVAPRGTSSRMRPPARPPSSVPTDSPHQVGSSSHTAAAALLQGGNPLADMRANMASISRRAEL